MGITSMTTAKTLKTLRKAFKDFEAAYVGVETVCRDSEAIDPGVASTMMEDMQSVHFQFRRRWRNQHDHPS